MEILGKLFGSVAKVKLMRLFLLNPELALPTEEVIKRSRVSGVTTRKELKLLEEIGLVTKKTKNSNAIWQLNATFPLLSHLRSLVKSNLLDRRQELIRQFNRCGKISLLIVSGVLIEDEDSRADLLVVGERIKRGMLERTIKSVEAELGQELRYAIMATGDYTYRLNTSDKFLRDVLEYPHERLIDRLIHSVGQT
jgi:hypothetical protein